MKLVALGPCGTESQWAYPSSFIVDDLLLLDTGGATQWGPDQGPPPPSSILLTHAHFDHIQGLPFLAEAHAFSEKDPSLTVFGSPRVISDLRTHIFNGIIWPAFHKLPAPDRPCLAFQEVQLEKPWHLNGYTVEAVEVSHSVPSLGYILTSPQDHCLIYAGDTGPTEKIWNYVGDRRIDALLIEVSFPNGEEQLAGVTGHLTPRLLERELAKLPRNPYRVLVHHLKPRYRHLIVKELQALHCPSLEVVEPGRAYQIGTSLRNC